MKAAILVMLLLAGGQAQMLQDDWVRAQAVEQALQRQKLLDCALDMKLAWEAFWKLRTAHEESGTFDVRRHNQEAEAFDKLVRAMHRLQDAPGRPVRVK